MYLKTGSIMKLSSKIEKLFKQRFAPIMAGELRAKYIVQEEQLILKRSKPILDGFEKQLRQIYNNLKGTRTLNRLQGTINFAKLLRLFIVKYLLIIRALNSYHIIHMRTRRLHGCLWNEVLIQRNQCLRFLQK